MSEKIREWGVTRYTDRFKLIHIDSSEYEDLLEGYIDDDDARLIAAAPELLEEAEKLINLHVKAMNGNVADDVQWDSAVLNLRNTIAKAKGEQE